MLKKPIILIIILIISINILILLIIFTFTNDIINKSIQTSLIRDNSSFTHKYKFVSIIHGHRSIGITHGHTHGPVSVRNTYRLKSVGNTYRYKSLGNAEFTYEYRSVSKLSFSCSEKRLHFSFCRSKSKKCFELIHVDLCRPYSIPSIHSHK